MSKTLTQNLFDREFSFSTASSWIIDNEMKRHRTTRGKVWRDGTFSSSTKVTHGRHPQFRRPLAIQFIASRSKHVVDCANRNMWTSNVHRANSTDRPETNNSPSDTVSICVCSVSWIVYPFAIISVCRSALFPKPPNVRYRQMNQIQTWTLNNTTSNTYTILIEMQFLLTLSFYDRL